ncbi:MAG TPA: hypothetical protein VET88_16320, partial [Gammaproteobacteria bacterium]|nr:hypothetical protein [Gammaproteobacteria bacterium]
PTIECRESSDADPLPGKFAGPVAESLRPANHGAPAENSPVKTDHGSALTLDASRVSGRKATFTSIDVESELDETIVITAPFDAHFAKDSDQAKDDGDTQATPEQTSGLPTAAPPGLSAEHSEIDQGNSSDRTTSEDPPQRTGFLRRLFGLVRSPSRKRRKA